MKQSILNQARPDKFNLVLDLPNILRGKTDSLLGDNFKADTVNFTVFGTPVPAMEVPSISLPYGSQNHNTSSFSRKPYPPLILRFLIDNGYQNYWILWKWLNLFNDAETSLSDAVQPMYGVHNPNPGVANLTSRPSEGPWQQDGLTLNPFNQYTTDFDLFATDEYNNNIIKFKYTDVFITGLSEIEYDHQRDETLIVCRATFSYNQFRPELLRNIHSISC